MDESPVINKILLNKEGLTNSDAKVSDFVTTFKKWNLSNINNILAMMLLIIAK